MIIALRWLAHLKNDTKIAMQQRIFTDTPFGAVCFMSVHKNSILWQVWKKPFLLYQISNTPGPALRPALCGYKNRALCSLALITWKQNNNNSNNNNNVLQNRKQSFLLIHPCTLTFFLHRFVALQHDFTLCSIIT